PAAAALRAQTTFHAVPMVDVDGVFHGSYGKDAGPVDFNRDWGETPARPQIAALVEATAAWAAAHPYDLMIDLHAPHNGETACYVFGGDDHEAPAIAAARLRFVELLAKEAPPEIGFSVEDLRPRVPPPGSARDQQTRAHGVPVLSVE